MALQQILRGKYRHSQLLAKMTYNSRVTTLN